jgi:hypothetical protein
MLLNRTEGLVPSPHADAIYHADLFVVHGQGWMIGGAGKSRAAELASDDNPMAAIARDSVAIIRQGDELYGRHDPGALPVDRVEHERRHARHRLHVIAYCLSEAESIQAYADRPRQLAPVDNKMLAWMLSSQIYPAQWAPFYFSRDQFTRLVNRNLRVARFLELTDGVVGTKFLVVPWMPDVEAKADLYHRHAQGRRHAD